MSVEARLQALVQSYRSQYGDAALAQSPQLIAQLSVQAPDLHGEIKALAAAINRSAAARIAAAADQEAEAGRVATEIAGSEKLSMAVVTAAVTVARGLGPIGAAPATPTMPPVPAAAGGAGWAGETVVATPTTQRPTTQPPTPGYPAQAGAPGYVPPGSLSPGATAAKPIYKNPLAIGGVAVAAVLLFLWSQGSDAPVRNDQGPTPPPGKQAQAGPYPTLRRDGELPTLTFNRDQSGLAITFQMEVPGGVAPGAVILPANGWDSGQAQIAFGRAGDVPPQVQVANDGTMRMQRMRGERGAPARAGQVQWQRDNLSLGSICVAFQGRAGQAAGGDVGLSGTMMCVMDGNCQQATACGRLAAGSRR